MGKTISKAEQKKKLRSVYLKKRSEMELIKRQEGSRKIAEKVLSSNPFGAARTVFVYASYKSEVETRKLIQEAVARGKRVAVPKVNGDSMDFFVIRAWEDLFPGHQGILEPQITTEEPVYPGENDLMLLPGAVFDRNGVRIGYGGGYYDKYLERIEETNGSKLYKMGLCFECQIYPGKLPAEAYDKKMDCILTERRVIMPKEKKKRKLAAVADVAEFLLELVIEFVIELID